MTTDTTFGPPTLPCTACLEQATPTLRWRTHAGGSRAIEATCPRCRRWLKWLEQTPENVARTVVSKEEGTPAVGPRQGSLFGG